MDCKILSATENRPYLYSTGIVFAASILLLFIEWNNHGLHLPDFEVYYKSALRILNGDNLYRVPGDGHYVFRYSPAFAAMFIPFTILPYDIAKILFWFVLAGVTASSLVFCLQFAAPGLNIRSPKKFQSYILLLLLTIGLFLYREFMLGQVNMMLFLSYLLIIRYIQLKKPALPAFIWAAGIMFKPWGLILLPYFLLKRDYKLVIYFIGFILLLFLLPIVFYGYDDMLEQTGKWFHELLIAFEHKYDLQSFDLTIFHVIYSYTPLRLVEISGYWEYVYKIVVLCLLGVLVLLFIRKGIGIDGQEVATGALLIGLMPLIAQPNYNAFLLIGLALAIVMVRFKKLPLWCKILFPVGVLLLGGNYNDVWGTRLSDRFLELAFVSIGAMIILSSLFVVRWKKIA